MFIFMLMLLGEYRFVWLGREFCRKEQQVDVKGKPGAWGRGGGLKACIAEKEGGYSTPGRHPLVTISVVNINANVKSLLSEFSSSNKRMTERTCSQLIATGNTFICTHKYKHTCL